MSEGFEAVDAFFLVPGYASGEVLFDVGGEGAEDLVVSVYIVDMGFVSAFRSVGLPG